MIEMKRFAPLLIPVFMAFAGGCGNVPAKTTDDIVVLPLGGEVKVTEGSIVYALPMTVLEFDIIAEKMIEVPGPYARYAAEMIGLDNVITAENEVWTLAEVKMKTIEELDPEQFYVIQGTSLMQTNLLALKENGLVLDINPENYSRSVFSDLQQGDDLPELLFPDRGAYEYVSTKTDTAYRLVKADTAFIRVPYLVQKKSGMTLEEQAREAAERLLELREGRHLILTGETNIFPQDGAALEEINRLEREYTALFAGKTWTERKHFRIWFTPELQMTGEKTAVFRFSESEGVLPAGGTGGRPVEIEMTASGKTRELKLVVRPPSSQKDLATQDRLYYRVPDVVEARVITGDDILCTARMLIYQFGNTVTLPSNFIIGK
ncbi:DUF4831 family protein [bacterium]|nr:DUF4831 family protein [bacterium]